MVYGLPEGPVGREHRDGNLGQARTPAGPWEQWRSISRGSPFRTTARTARRPRGLPSTRGRWRTGTAEGRRATAPKPGRGGSRTGCLSKFGTPRVHYLYTWSHLLWQNLYRSLAPADLCSIQTLSFPSSRSLSFPSFRFLSIHSFLNADRSFGCLGRSVERGRSCLPHQLERPKPCYGHCRLSVPVEVHASFWTETQSSNLRILLSLDRIIFSS